MSRFDKHSNSGHPFDIKWLGATICWDKDRGCWVLPGGAITRIESVALAAARSIAALLADKQTFTRKIAA